MRSIGSDVGALDRWFSVPGNRDRLYNFVYRFIGSSSDSCVMPEDIVQSTYVRAKLRISRNGEGEEFGETYIFTIAGNLAKSELMRRARWKKVGIGEGDESCKSGGNGYAVLLSLTDIAEEVELKERSFLTCHLTNELIGVLPEKQKKPIIMYHFQGLSYKDIAESLRIPMGTVKSRISRGRKNLRNNERAAELESLLN